MSVTLEERSFDTGSVVLHYVEGGGGGAPPLLLLHGGAWCWQEFLPLVPVLGTRRRIHAMDLRGHGRSGHTPGHYRIVDFADDVATFLERRIGEPAVIQGHSLGAVVAIVVAVRHPEMVKALILEEPALSLENYRQVVTGAKDVYAAWSALAGGSRSAFDLARDLADTIVGGAGGAKDSGEGADAADAGRGKPLRFGDIPGVTQDWLMFLGLCLRGLDPTFLTFLLEHYDEFLSGFDPAHFLPKVECPTLLLHGESRLGGVLPSEVIEEARAILPRGAIVVGYEGVGHELHMAMTDPIARTVLRFLEML